VTEFRSAPAEHARPKPRRETPTEPPEASTSTKPATPNPSVGNRSAFQIREVSPQPQNTSHPEGAGASKPVSSTRFGEFESQVLRPDQIHRSYDSPRRAGSPCNWEIRYGRSP
jgi:hypothetical protein